ncbi:MAG TPA: hypothetical protein VIH35_07290, partial [Kiritimatiellia bacterium]
TGLLKYKTELDEMDVQVGEYQGVKVYLGLKTAGRFQALEQSDVLATPAPTDENPKPEPAKVPDIDPGFQTAWGSMDFLANFEDVIKVYWEFYISSRPHPDSMQGHQGYLLIEELPGDQLKFLFDYVDIKAGEFEVNFGDALHRRSDNARVQRNPLIGNYVMDPNVTEIGLELIGEPARVNWLVGVTSGSATGDNKNETGVGGHAKVWCNPLDNLRVALSGYNVDHSDTLPGSEGSRTILFSSSRSGGPYGAIFNGGNNPGGVNPPAGKKITAGQTDVTLALGDLELYGNFGYVEDADTNANTDGEPEEAWYYYAAEGVYRFTEKFYGALRYSAAQADTAKDQASDGIVSRYQAGIGYWFSANLLAKAEYVYEEMKDFDDADGNVSGVKASEDPSFDGIIGEVSFAF